MALRLAPRSQLPVDVRESRAAALRELHESGRRGAIVPVQFFGVALREAKNAPLGTVRVLAISEGPGNPTDRRYYTQKFIESLVPKLNGCDAYLNHPSLSEDRDRPERDVRDKCGWFEKGAVEIIDRRAAAVATFHPRVGDPTIESLLETARLKAATYPDAEPFCAWSINANGVGAPGKSPEDGREAMIMEACTDLASVDVVTTAGARGASLWGPRESRGRLGSVWSLTAARERSAAQVERGKRLGAPNFVRKQRV